MKRLVWRMWWWWYGEDMAKGKLVWLMRVVMAAKGFYLHHCHLQLSRVPLIFIRPLGAIVNKGLVALSNEWRDIRVVKNSFFCPAVPITGFSTVPHNVFQSRMYFTITHFTAEMGLTLFLSHCAHIPSLPRRPPLPSPLPFL